MQPSQPGRSSRFVGALTVLHDEHARRDECYDERIDGRTAPAATNSRRTGGRNNVPLAIRQQDDFAEHSAFAQHLVRAARLFERQALRDQGLDLALFEQIQQQ
jgi:hypothetical protein